MSPARILLYEDDPAAAQLAAAAALKAGKCVVYPTDTVYGLMAHVDSEEAYKGIYALKQRDPAKPIAALACPSAPAATAAEKALADESGLLAEFRTGRLTVVLEEELLSGLPAAMRRVQPGSLGLRCPADARSRRLLGAVGGMAWATSVNHSGEAPATTQDEVQAWCRSISQPGLALAVVTAEPLPGQPSAVVLRNDGRWRQLRQA